MNVESVLSLVRLAEHGDGVVANLAKVMLSLVQKLRECETRAGMAEAALEAERAKMASVRSAIERLRGRPDISPDDYQILSHVAG